MGLLGDGRGDGLRTGDMAQGMWDEGLEMTLM